MVFCPWQSTSQRRQAERHTYPWQSGSSFPGGRTRPSWILIIPACGNPVLGWTGASLFHSSPPLWGETDTAHMRENGSVSVVVWFPEELDTAGERCLEPWSLDLCQSRSWWSLFQWSRLHSQLSSCRSEGLVLAFFLGGDSGLLSHRAGECLTDAGTYTMDFMDFLNFIPVTCFLPRFDSSDSDNSSSGYSQSSDEQDMECASARLWHLLCLASALAWFCSNKS